MSDAWKPSMPIAIVLGLLAPGAGLLYAGRPIVAVVAAVLYWAVTVGVPALVVDIAPTKIIPITASAMIVLFIVNALAGGFVAGTTRATTRRPFQHLWWVAGFGLVGQV